METEDTDRLYELFHPRAVQRVKLVEDENLRFVHYTTAEAATNIICDKEIWMRRVSCMSDYLEVMHGEGCMSAAFSSQTGKDFWAIIDAISPDLKTEISNLFDGWLPSFMTETYITCVSEHLAKEDTLGRLSMWRAYSGRLGVALVFKNEVFRTPGNTVGLTASPVEYLDDPGFEIHLREIVSGLENNIEFIRNQSSETLKAYIFNMAKFALLSTKHPGFEEEKEWRIIYCPFLEKEQNLPEKIQSVNGVPQNIYKIPLKDNPDLGLSGLEIPNLLDRVIIGPNDFGWPMRDAFVQLLGESGVENPNERVFVSNIPLR